MRNPPPKEGKRSATECSTTVQRDRVTVAVGQVKAPLVNSLPCPSRAKVAWNFLFFTAFLA